MEYDSTYHTNCCLRLESGRELILDSLTQTRTYTGLLEGTPNKKLNDRLIQDALERARQHSVLNSEPFLMEPERRSNLREPDDMTPFLRGQESRPPESRRIPEWLPEIECIGRFHSFPPARDPSQDASSLTIVWYQRVFGIDQTAVEKLRTVDWETHAIDWEF